MSWALAEENSLLTHLKKLINNERPMKLVITYIERR